MTRPNDTEKKQQRIEKKEKNFVCLQRFFSPMASATVKTTESILVWLDDNAGIDPQLNEIFRHLFTDVKYFKSPETCLQYLISVESPTPCISILVSGRHGQQHVPDRIQPLDQVKSIYVFCMDVQRHNQWAKNCNKVRCVQTDLSEILKQMEIEEKKKLTFSKAETEDVMEIDENNEDESLPPTEPLRYFIDQNLYDQLALRLILENSDHDEMEHFKIFCQNHHDESDKLFKVNQPISQWFRLDLPFVRICSTNFDQLWSLRWFIRSFHEQICKEHNELIRNSKNFLVHHSAWLNDDEFERMKNQLGQTIIFNEFHLGHFDLDESLKFFGNPSPSPLLKHKILFEIRINAEQTETVPFAQLERDQLLIWFGARYRLTKIELIEEIQNKQVEPFWSIGLTLCSTIDSQPATKELIEFYWKNLSELKNLHLALAKILIDKGLYSEAMVRLEKGKNYLELTELAIRRSDYEQAERFLVELPEDADETKLLRAYLFILKSADTIGRGRQILTEIFAESNDRFVRIRANIALGYLSLTATQQSSQAFDQFKVAHAVSAKLFPENHPNVAKSLIGLGYAQLANGNVVEAKKSFEFALKKQQISLPNEHPDLAKSHACLAHCYAAENQRLKDAIRHLNLALTILRRTYFYEQKFHPEILGNFHDLKQLQKGKKLRSKLSLLDYI